MSEAEEGAEKSYEATPQRIEDARRKGDVPISKDLAALAAYIGLILALSLAGSNAVRQVGNSLSGFLARAETLAPRVLDQGGAGLSLGAITNALAPLTMLFALPAALVLVVLVAQRGIIFAPEKIEPKLSRLSPLSQAKQKFGPTGLFEFAKSTTKLIIIATVLGLYLNDKRDVIVGSVNAAPFAAAAELARLVTGLLVRIAVVAAAIAVVDLIWQRFDHARKLRMTHQEIKEEHKRAEGDPHAKQQRRQRAEEIANNRMMHDVPTADVIIVNPTHYAVALKWKRGDGGAPIVVAKGIDGIALRIREVASNSGVPIHSDPPTARALESTTEIGQEIKPEHYKAVAAAIRFAEAMRRKAREQGRGWNS
ncbi:MAG: EscU/YscU/HrcU family type III secretion system export apparatus switch protein [Pikeienuella sp.]